MNSLEALKILYPNKTYLPYYTRSEKRNACKVIERELKALEIIKNKIVDLEYLKCCENYDQYKTLCSYWNEITEQEYDLLKEVLEWKN